MDEIMRDRHIDGLDVEEELHLKEAAMDGAPVGITISDSERSDNPLIYVNDSFCEITGYDRSEIIGTNCRFLQGEETNMSRVSELGRAVSEEEQVAVELKNYRKDGSLFWNRVEIAPIRDGSDSPRYFVGYQADVSDRKEAELALEEERETLDQVLSRVVSLVPAISEAVVNSDSREALERAIVERFDEQPDLDFAWLGRYNPSTGLLRPVIGSERPTESFMIHNWSTTSLSESVETGAVQIASETDDLFSQQVDPVAAALIPLQYRHTVYGVLAVGTTDPEGFDERVTAVMEAVGQAAGAAINALEHASLSGGETLVEVRLEVADPTMALVDLAKTVGCEITSEGQFVDSDDPSLLVTLRNVPDRTAADVAALGEHVEPIGGSEEMTVEWTVPDGPLVRSLVEDAVRLDGLSATPSSARFRFRAASEHMANTVVGRFRDGYEGVELLAFHEISDRGSAEMGFRDNVSEQLTDRQHEALQKAHLTGFFDWPRSVGGETLANAMDIHPTTFHQHLRAAERKLITAYFDR